MPKKNKLDLRAKLNSLGNGIKKIAKKTWAGTKSIAKKAFRGFMNAKTFWCAFAILVILLIISVVVLSIRIHDYSKVDDRSVSLRSSMDESLNVFAMEYKNDSGEIIIQGQDGEKVIAPGTDVEYTLRLRNIDKIALDYSFVPALNYTSEYKLPIEIRLLDPNDDYIIGNETTWIPLDEIGDVTCNGTLLQNETAEYVFQWRWPYEAGNDEYDSFLGDLTFASDVGVNLDFSVHSEANTTIKSNGGFFQSQPGKVTVLVIIAVLLAVAITLLLIHIIYKIKARKNAIPVITEPSVVQEAEVPMVEAIVPAPIAAPQPKPVFTGKMAYVNLDAIEAQFESGDVITIGALKEKGLIPQNAKQMKVLAKSITALEKAFTVETQGISKNAEVSICRAGGHVVITAPDDMGDK